MGTWGPGNFDSDTAADHLSILTARLTSEIEEAMSDPESLEAGEYWEVGVPANLELLTLIAKRKYVGATLPSVATIDAWKQTYMPIWDETIDALDPKPEYRKARRRVLLATFASIRRLAVARAKG